MVIISIFSILIVHFAATVILLGVVDDNMGERAAGFARQALLEKYAAEEYRVEAGSGFHAMVGHSPIALFDFPYQVLYWKLSLESEFLAPMMVGFYYTVFDDDGLFVKSGSALYYVYSNDRMVMGDLQH